MNALKVYLLIPLLLLLNLLMAQNYQAIKGSVFAGSLGAANNPASTVFVPYAWDITPFSVQFKQSTNAFTIDKYSYLSSPGSAKVKPQEGTKNRFFYANQDIHLLNTRISLNSRAAIAFGLNIRSYMYATSSVSNYQDSGHTLADFMKINTGNLPLSAEARGNAWAEVYATYAQTIIDDGDNILNAGLTLKGTRGLAGGYGIAQGLSYAPSFAGTRPGYVVTGGSLQYAYSANFDFLDSNKSAGANAKVFLQRTFSSVGADMGFEYIRLSDEDNEEGGDYSYETKIGVSLMDLGKNEYRHSSKSMVAVGIRPGITDTVIENKFSTVTTIDEFNDSLGKIAASARGLTGHFNVYQPARFMINIDQHIIHNIFINAELTIPIIQIVANNSLFVRDMNLLSITPRWELKSWGAYLPMTVNTEHQFWIGGAFKAGPVLFGTHNLANLFSKNKTQSGGLYLAFTIRPGRKYDREEHNPKNKPSRRDKKGLQCPGF